MLPATFLVVVCFYLGLTQYCAFHCSVNNHSTITQLTHCSSLFLYYCVFRIFTCSRSAKSYFDPWDYSRSTSFFHYLTQQQSAFLSHEQFIFFVVSNISFHFIGKCRSFIFKFWLLIMIIFQRNSVTFVK